MSSDWISERFCDARVSPDPFPHLIIENVLPTDLYRAIERDIPPSRDWRLAALAQAILAQARNWRSSSLRRFISEGVAPQVGIDLSGMRRTPFLRRHSRRWSRSYLATAELISSLVERTFADHSARYMRAAIEVGLYDAPQKQKVAFQDFCLRTEGWAIRPHVHDLRQAIQWMLYVPQPGSTEDQGTAFYRVTKPKTIPAADIAKTIWFEPDEVQLSFVAPYRANTLVAFLNTPTSVHGSLAIPDMVARRYFFVGSYWEETPRAIDLTAPPKSGLDALESSEVPRSRFSGRTA